MLMGIILAAAGGGSSGFGGGGGGGGGFSGGGGGYRGGGYGGGGYGGGGGGFSLTAVVIILVVIGLISAAGYLQRQALVHQVRKRRQTRDRRVRTASAEAAEDDDAFAADLVDSRSVELFGAIQLAWDARDRERLASLVGADLMAEWTLRLDDFARKGWHNRVQVLSGPEVSYVGMDNQADDAEDRCVVFLQAQMEDYVQTSSGQTINHNGADSTQTTVAEYWTLAKRDGIWILDSIEQQAEGDHHLDERIVASPWGDEQKLRDESLVEGAVADKALPGYKTSDLVDVDYAGDAHAQALDLSLADARFGPDVLEIAARRAVAAWVRAVDGPDYTLLAVATPEAAHALLYPGEPAETARRRVVVRGVHVDALSIEGLDSASEPARMTLAVRATGRRYVEDRETAAVLSGDKDHATTFTEQMTFALSDSDKEPWTLVAAA